MYDGLAAHQIYPRKYFYPLTNAFQCYEERFSCEDTPVAKYIGDRVLTSAVRGLRPGGCGPDLPGDTGTGKAERNRRDEYIADKRGQTELSGAVL